MKHETVSVTDFKAHCLRLFDRLLDGSVAAIEVTRRGKVIAVVSSPPTAECDARSIHGSMAGMALISPDVDLTAPQFDDELEAAEGLAFS